MESFRALVVSRTESGQQAGIEQWTPAQLMDGDVTVQVDCSTLNYKDALAVTGRSPIIRVFPLIPGIDFAGTVSASTHAGYAVGDRVVLNGWGVGEKHHGGYAEVARVRGDWLVPLPAAFSTRAAMAIGTAGYTAMLCVLALEEHGVSPAGGDVLVTGAAGGVGSVAIALLAKLGYRAVAVTGRAEESAYLESLGAAEVLPRAEFSQPGKPLGKERWAAAIDCVGSHVLANVLAQIRYGGVVAACGLAAGMDLPTTVMPFILRNVALVGVDSVMVPRARRLEAWQRLAADLDAAKLERMTGSIDLADVPAQAEALLAGRVRGRCIVDVRAGA